MSEERRKGREDLIIRLGIADKLGQSTLARLHVQHLSSDKGSMMSFDMC